MRKTMLATLTSVATVASLVFAAAAFAYSESYGGNLLCINCYIETSGAHTFVGNYGDGNNIEMACQLFQKSGSYNHVAHGYDQCFVSGPGAGTYTWGRVYNQDTYRQYTSGYAYT